MAAAEMRAAWHRTAATCYMLHEDSKRGSDCNKPDESYSSSRTKTPPANSKSELSEAWNAVSSHYFVPDRKLDFHFHIENDGESPSKAKSLLQVEVGAGAGTAKSLEMDWQTVDSPSTYSADGKAADKDWTLAEKTSVSCLSDSSFRALAARNLELITQTGPRWRHANKGELAALIARKSSEDMGNCDLPPPLSPAAAKGLKEDASHGGIGLEKVAAPPGLPSSAPPPSTFRPGSLDTKMKSKNSPEESHAKRSAHAEEDRNEEALFWKELDSELLGEALCRSQTRAREAEKRAVEAMSERDQLLKLFFREASVTLTYKHWVKYLEAENSILRRQDEEEVEAEEENAAENKQDNKRSSKRQQQDAARSKKRRHSDHHSVAVLGCGLAFALGVGLAGAGVVFGCTMGWILIAF